MPVSSASLAAAACASSYPSGMATGSLWHSCLVPGPVTCPYCPPLEPQQVVRFADDLVLYLDDERWQGALKHSGIIVPVRHAETVFELTADEVAATFRMLARAKEWLDRDTPPTATTSAGTPAPSPASRSSTPTST